MINLYQRGSKVELWCCANYICDIHSFKSAYNCIKMLKKLTGLPVGFMTLCGLFPLSKEDLKYRFNFFDNDEGLILDLIPD